MEFEFATNETVEDISKVPEDFRSFYQEANGQYVLADPFKASAKAYDGLNKSLRATRKEVEAARKNRPDVSGYTQLGSLLGIEDEVTPDALKAGIEDLMNKLSKGEGAKVNWDKMKADLEKAHQKALGEKDGENKAMYGTLVQHLVESEAVRAIAAYKGVPEFLLPHIKARTAVVKDGDKYVVRVVDEAGDPRGNSSGGFMSIEDLVKEMRSDKVFGRAFESDAPSGTGVQPGSQQRQPTSQQNLSPTDRIAKGLGARR